MNLFWPNDTLLSDVLVNIGSRVHMQLIPCKGITWNNADLLQVRFTGLPTSEILFPYFVEKISVFWVTFPYPLICSSPESKLISQKSLGNFLFTLVGPVHSQWKL